VIVRARLARLRETRWWEYLVRFAFGGAVTAATGIVAKEFGPAVAGLFLAFPGIFPAGVTLVERHERRKKRKRGLSGTRRGRLAGAVVSAGAVPGALGLIAFALAARALLPRYPAWLALAAALAAWTVASIALWILRFRLRFRRAASGR
jgi:hypothetical protein